MATFTGYPAATADDGYEEAAASWAIYPLIVGDTYNAGIRFPSVTVPQGATITSATITLHAERFSGTITNVHAIQKGDDVDDAAAWSSTSRPSQITPTTASGVDWDPTAWTSNAAYVLPAITDIVQEIVSRAGWASGNAMRFAILDDGSSASAYARGWEYGDGGGETYNPKLTIEYTEGGAGLTFTATDAQGTQADTTAGFRTMAATVTDNLNA